ncbi:MAG: glycosyl hydrolase family 18 protein [Christensenellales bacterium]|jgi:spore germination protein
MEIHVVQSGETILGIAGMYNVSPQKIITDNGLENQDTLVVGQALLIQFPEIVHTVQPGETLMQIALQYGVTVLALQQNNPQLTTQLSLRPGEQITIRYRGERIREVAINGYAYPHINPSVLLRTLPFLTMLTIFGYGFTQAGELIEIDDQSLINMAYQFRVAPIMLLSSITEDGNFSGERASLLFQDTAFQNALIDKIIQKMWEKGYLGLDVDFEYINPEDADAFMAFLRNITERLNAQGFSVNVDLAPKISGDQMGLLYEAHDYPRAGAIANTVLLMTYEWGFSHGPPMAVAPINQVRRVVSYAVGVIPVEKIFMGIPNYGYVWRLPYQRDITVATSIGNQYAVQLAAQYRTQIQFDETAQSPFFYYTNQEGFRHVVWFEDVRSIQAKWNLIDENSLLGAGYWSLLRPFAQNWAYVNGLYTIRKIVE